MITIVTEDNTIHIVLRESEFLKLLEEDEDFDKIANTLLKKAFKNVMKRRKEDSEE